VETFNVHNAEAFQQANHISHKLHILLKFRNKQKILVDDSVLWNLFTVQCGRTPLAAEMNPLQQVVDKGLRKIQSDSKGLRFRVSLSVSVFCYVVLVRDYVFV